MRLTRSPVEDGGVSKFSRILGLTILAAIVPWLAAVGAMLDEADHLGFTNWQAACRAAGPSFGSLVYFTWELLPATLTGALSGGVILQLLAFRLRRESRHAAACVSVHLACVLTLPISLLICALAWPVPAMLLADVALAVVVALLIGLLWSKGSPEPAPSHP